MSSDKFAVLYKRTKGVRVMMFNTNFNNISVILWQSFLWWRNQEKNHRPVESH